MKSIKCLKRKKDFLLQNYLEQQSGDYVLKLLYAFIHGIISCTTFLKQLPSFVRVRDASGRALCDIHDDYTALRRRAKFLDDIVTIRRDVPRAVRL